MRIPLKSDYALRAAGVIARSWPEGRVRAEDIATAEGLPITYLDTILANLRVAGILRGRRGYHGGYLLDRAPHEITVAEILRAVDCPLVAEPDSLKGSPVAALWSAVEVSIGAVLADCSLADLAELTDRRRP